MCGPGRAPTGGSRDARVPWRTGSSTESPRIGRSHLQLQGRPLSCLHTGQAAPASLDPQENGNLGAVQVSVGKYAYLLWKGRQERARA